MMGGAGEKYVSASTNDDDRDLPLDDDNISFTPVKLGRKGRKGSALLCLSVISLTLAVVVAVLCLLLVPTDKEGEEARLEVDVERMENTVEELEAGEVTAADCSAEADAGPCLAAAQRWFYNSRKGQCDQVTCGAAQ